jgi:hypothetical protein
VFAVMLILFVCLCLVYRAFKNVEKLKINVF